jgi:hypothetical protein
MIPKNRLNVGAGIIKTRAEILTGFVAGDCMYMQDCAREEAWIEGKSVELEEWR